MDELRVEPGRIAAFRTREDYLGAALVEMRSSLFGSVGFKVPEKIRLSCAFPKGARGGKGHRAIGQVWDTTASEDGTFEVFVSPVLGRQDPVTVLGTLVHEIVHTIAGLPAKHGPLFRKVAEACGLAGHMTATVPSEELETYLRVLVRHLGTYPHGSMIERNREHPGSRMVKASCPACGYIIRTTRTWIDNAGLPTCPCGEQFVEG